MIVYKNTDVPILTYRSEIWDLNLTNCDTGSMQAMKIRYLSKLEGLYFATKTFFIFRICIIS